MNPHQDIASQDAGSRRAPQGLRTNSLSTFRPGDLLDGLIVQMNLKNDAALARALDISAPTISKIRRRTLPVSATVLLQMHEASGFAIKDLRAWMGDHRRRFGLCDEGQ